MKTLDSGFLAELAATVTRPVALVEIGFSVPLRLSSGGDVSWNGYVWTGTQIRVDGLAADGSGRGQASIRLGNHDNLVGAYLLNERIADKPMKVYAAWLDAGGTPHVTPAFFGAGDSAQVGATEVVIEVVESGTAQLHAPRLMISAANGFNHLRPAGTKFSWNGVDYTLERRTS